MKSLSKALLIALIAALLLPLLGPSQNVTLAQPPRPAVQKAFQRVEYQGEKVLNLADFPEIQARVQQILARIAGKGDDETVHVMLEMAGEPLARVYARQKAAGRGLMSADLQRAHVRSLEAAQARVVAGVKAQGGTVISQLQKVYNGVHVRVRRSQLEALRKLPGVVAVHRMPVYELDLEDSVPWIGAQQVIDDLGITGEGVTIGIIDTGIDYYHANLGGSGDPDDYAADDPTVIEPGTFPTAKVIGGIDLVGVLYDAGCTPEEEEEGVCTTIPQPDPDPLDVNGHGSHVAGIAAGLGVPGMIHNGVAPGASLYAIKVFGDVTGSTNVVPEALEHAVDPNGDGDVSDHLDVVNMSLGCPYGCGGPSNIDIEPTNNAVALGVIVVASAGNEADVPYITGSPAAAEKAISVASSFASGETALALRVNSPASIAGDYEAIEAAISPPLAEVGPVTGDVAYVGRYCSPDFGEPGVPQDAALDDPAGKIALIDRGACTFATKFFRAQAAGATAIIVANNVAGAPIRMGGDICRMIGGQEVCIGIPGVMISLADGNTLKSVMPGETVNATMSADVVIPKPELADVLSGFTSRGPSLGNQILKPEITAPGSNIFSTNVGTGDGGVFASGTSMSAPHIAGVAALLRQAHPDWSPDHVKAAMMNTAKPETYRSSNVVGDQAPISRQGAGRVQAFEAATTESLATTGSSSLSFGFQALTDAYEATKTVTVENTSTGNKSYTLDWSFLFASDEDAGVGLTLSAAAGLTGRAIVRDGAAASDRLIVNLSNVAPPSAGSVYEGWLVSDDGSAKLSVGLLDVALGGTVSYTYTSPTGENLIGAYSRFVITVEPEGDTDPNPSGVVAVSDAIGPGAMAHIRHLMSAWSPTPGGIGLAQGLRGQAQTASTHAGLAAGSTTLAALKQHAEHVVNIIEGQDGDNFGDLDGNGAAQNPGDGFGILQATADGNGDGTVNEGYAEGTRKHAGFAAAQADADATIQLHAQHVMDTSNNVKDWAAQARDKALAVLAATDLATAQALALEMQALADQALNGTDADGDGAVEPIPGEGGAVTAYEHGQNMAWYTPAGPQTLTVPAGGSASFDVTLTADPAAIHTYQLNAGSRGNRGDLLTVSEYDGYVMINELSADGDNLRVPFHFLPRQASAISADDMVSLTGFYAPGPLALDNTSAFGGASDIFALLEESPVQDGSQGFADLRYSGVKNTFVEGLGNVIEFGFHTYEPRTVALQAEFDIYMDVDQDGTPDYVLLNYDLGILQGRGCCDGRNATALLDLTTGALVLQFFTGTDFNSNNIILPVLAEDMGLSSENLAMDLFVAVWDVFEVGPELADVAPADFFETGVPFRWDGRYPFLQAEPNYVEVGSSVTVDVSAEPYGIVASPSVAETSSLLVLHSGNVPGGGEAETVAVDVPYEVREVAIQAHPAATGNVVSTKVLGNNFGGAPLYTGSDTRGRWPVIYHGAVQFDLSAIPTDGYILGAQAELTGLTDQFLGELVRGTWDLWLLDEAVDTTWTGLGYWHISRAEVVAKIGDTLTEDDLGVGTVNAFPFTLSEAMTLGDRLATTGKASFRLDSTVDRARRRHIFAWDGGGAAGAGASPVLRVTYVVSP